MIRTANPALNDEVFANARLTGLDRKRSTDAQMANTMTLGGTVNKTGILLFITMGTAYMAWTRSIQHVGPLGEESVFVPSPLLWVGAIGGFVVGLATVFKKTWAPYSAPLYAALEGLMLGAVSAGFEVRFPGIVFQAVLGTFGTLAALLMAYRSGLIRATENFKLGVAAATGGIMLMYLISFVMGLFGTSVPYIHESGAIGIGFSLFVVVIAALNLVLDFDFIENGAEQRAPKYMEWYAAFGLLVTLVWLYLEMLRLLAKLRSRD